MKISSRVEFGKVLYFIQADLQRGGLVVESACVQLFSAPIEDKESGLWNVDAASLFQYQSV